MGANDLPEGLEPADLLRFYRTMVTSRRIDDREISLKRQNKIFFQISGAGHEAIRVAVAAHLRPGHDWFYPYYRDRALALSLGRPPWTSFSRPLEPRTTPNRRAADAGALRRASRFNIASTSSPTGTQFLQAVGAAEAGYRAIAPTRSSGTDHELRRTTRSSWSPPATAPPPRASSGRR